MSCVLPLSQENVTAVQEIIDQQQRSSPEVYIATRFVQDQAARIKSGHSAMDAQSDHICQTRSTRRSERSKNKNNKESMRTREFKSSDSSLLETRSCLSDSLVSPNKGDQPIHWSSSHYSQYEDEINARQQELRSELPVHSEDVLDNTPFKELSGGLARNQEPAAKSAHYMKPFEKPTRRPMRDDRGSKKKKRRSVPVTEGKAKKKSKLDASTSEVGHEGRKRRGKKTETTKKSKPITGLVSTLANITESISSSRLTLPHKPSAGIFNHGRQASNRPSSGVPDLSFTRIEKLTEPSKSSSAPRHGKLMVTVESKQSSSVHDYMRDAELMKDSVNTVPTAKDQLLMSRPSQQKSITDGAEMSNEEYYGSSSQAAKTKQPAQDQNAIISPWPVHARETRVVAALEESAIEQTTPVSDTQTSRISQLSVPALDTTPSVAIEDPQILAHPKELFRMVQEYSPHGSASKTYTQVSTLPQARSHLLSIVPNQAIYKSSEHNQYSFCQEGRMYRPLTETAAHDYQEWFLRHPTSAHDEHYESDAYYPFSFGEGSGVGNRYSETADDDFDPSVPRIRLYDGRDDLSGRPVQINNTLLSYPECRDYRALENDRADETYVNDESSIPGVTTSAYGQHIPSAECGNIGFDQYINNDYQYMTDTSVSALDLSVSDHQPVITAAESGEETSRLHSTSYCYGAHSDTNIYHADSPEPPKFKRHRLY
ncbi:hypothetical protein V1517DRAFT_306039 [Lipomyces orientalis]|uniref:Uncharacterized protein n=1 Tax=Lipomyces orientalis TaxID=1233043 RepID=A0ACC3TTR4_9ASCO